MEVLVTMVFAIALKDITAPIVQILIHAIFLTFFVNVESVTMENASVISVGKATAAALKHDLHSLDITQLQNTVLDWTL
tara:strand:- start:106 stop:342 length:237 start_codon:yes stop_codon:yes gene_type:complete